jgi:hypothetical protein
MKQKIKYSVATMDLERESLVYEHIVELSKILQKYSDRTLFFNIEKEEDYCSNENYYMEIFAERDETDEEYEMRLLREKARELQKKRKTDLEQAKRFKLYQELKKEFEQ